MALLQKTTQLATGGTWQGIAAEIDLAERHREQFTRQHKNPILRGVIDSGTKFRFIISPRQRVKQRTFRIPFFMSRYSIERGIESGPYPVSAYILIKNKKAEELELNACGNYKIFGSASRSGDKDPINPINFGNNGKKNKDEEGCETITVQLQRTEPQETPPVVKVSQEEPNRINLSWGDRKIIANSLCEDTTDKSASVRLVDIAPEVDRAVLKQGEFKNNQIFWIETSTKDITTKGKEFKLRLEFCSNGTTIRSQPVSYIAKKQYQSDVSMVLSQSFRMSEQIHSFGPPYPASE